MIDDVVKDCLRSELQQARDALVWKLVNLSEYDVRRPLTVTGTNLLGLVQHCATWEARYFGEVFQRPFPGTLPDWQESEGDDLWVTEMESREGVIGFFRDAQRHADATIAALPMDAPGHVPWWPRPDVTLLSVLVHVLADTTRHAGHADILREGLDGRTGVSPGHADPIDAVEREAHWATIEKSARAARAALSGEC